MCTRTFFHPIVSHHHRFPRFLSNNMNLCEFSPHFSSSFILVQMMECFSSRETGCLWSQVNFPSFFLCALHSESFFHIFADNKMRRHPKNIRIFPFFFRFSYSLHSSSFEFSSKQFKKIFSNEIYFLFRHLCKWNERQKIERRVNFIINFDIFFFVFSRLSLNWDFHILQVFFFLMTLSGDEKCWFFWLNLAQKWTKKSFSQL